MRAICVTTGLALTLACGGRLAADPAPYTATVTAAQADVHSGPSNDQKFYVTNRLQKGATVQVVRDRGDGWLEIRPPEGSYSWIDIRHVQQLVPTQPQNLVVLDANSEVYIGSQFDKLEPTVIGSRLEKSTQVRLHTPSAEPWTDNHGNRWIRIDPPAREVRYLSADAVAKAPAAAAVTPPGGPVPVTAAAASSYQSGTAPAPESTTAAKPTTSHAEVDELYAKAVEADRVGRKAEAVQLYSKVGYLGKPINHTMVPAALQRAAALVTPPYYGEQPQPESRYRPLTAEPAPVPPPPTAHLNQPYSATLPAQVPTTPVNANYTGTPQGVQPVAATGTPRFIGQLRKAGRVKNDQVTYVLEADNMTRCYVNPGQGVNLDAYKGQRVELIGTAYYDGEMRANYILATQVRPAQ